MKTSVFAAKTVGSVYKKFTDELQAVITQNRKVGDVEGAKQEALMAKHDTSVNIQAAAALEVKSAEKAIANIGELLGVQTD